MVIKKLFIAIISLECCLASADQSCFQMLLSEREMTLISSNLMLSNILYLNEDIFRDNMTLADVGT